MMTIELKKLKQLIVILIAFIIFSLPLASLCYAAPSEPDHVLSYEYKWNKPRLKWEIGTSVKPNGTVYLSLFKNAYQNVASNGDRVIAPGTSGENIIRINNKHNDTIKYTAVIYDVRSNDDLPVTVSVADGTYIDTDNYSIPSNDSHCRVLRAITGEITADSYQDFKINWEWEFEGSDTESDQHDTALGNKAASNRIKFNDIEIGVYITVEDMSYPNSPVRPKTDDRSPLTLYCFFAVLSIAGLMSTIYMFKQKQGGNTSGK